MIAKDKIVFKKIDLFINEQIKYLLKINHSYCEKKEDSEQNG